MKLRFEKEFWCMSWIPRNLLFRYISFHEKRLQTMLWHHNAKGSFHAKWVKFPKFSKGFKIAERYVSLPDCPVSITAHLFSLWVIPHQMSNMLPGDHLRFPWKIYCRWIYVYNEHFYKFFAYFLISCWNKNFEVTPPPKLIFTLRSIFNNFVMLYLSN